MNQNFTAKEVRAYARKLINVCMPSESMERAADMLNAYADTLSKPADSGRVVVSVFREPDEEQIAETVYNINRKTDKPTVDAFLVAQVWSNMMYARPIKAVEATLAAQGQGEPDPMEAIVQHCMVTEAVSPDSADPYGTISRVIDWHQANTAPPAVVPEGYVLVPREPTLDMQAAHQIHGDTSDWWNAVIEAAAPPAPSEEVE